MLKDFIFLLNFWGISDQFVTFFAPSQGSARAPERPALPSQVFLCKANANIEGFDVGLRVSFFPAAGTQRAGSVTDR